MKGLTAVRPDNMLRLTNLYRGPAAGMLAWDSILESLQVRDSKCVFPDIRQTDEEKSWEGSSRVLRRAGGEAESRGDLLNKMPNMLLR